MARSVGKSPELTRILAGERRIRDPAAELKLAEELTRWLKLRAGEMLIRPDQAQLLYEAYEYDGAVGMFSVGGGKTLPSVLYANCVRGCLRPLLVIPGTLRKKTIRDIARLGEHFGIPKLTILSYEDISHEDGMSKLENIAPDWIAFDEAHALANLRAACTKKVMRLFKNEDVNALILTGTLSQRSPQEYAHYMRLALGDRMPWPQGYHESEDWGSALGVQKSKNFFSRVKPGKLLLMANEEDWRDNAGEVTAARRAFARRLRETPGVVATTGSNCDARLTIRVVKRPCSQEVKEAIQTLKDLNATPDGWTYSEAATVWGKVRELACGFFYKWVPRPKQKWLDARKEWADGCRHVLTHNRRGLDSEKMVKRAVWAGGYPELEEPLERWQRLKPTYRGVQVGDWLDTQVRDYCAKWMCKPGIVWCEHTEFAVKLSEDTGVPYYGAHGLSADGSFIEDHDPSKPMIASILANGEGRNLQSWFRALYISPPPSGKRMEQSLGRMHRPGQLQPEVQITILVTCPEHEQAIEDMLRDAKYQEEISDQPQKLIYADWV